MSSASSIASRGGCNGGGPVDLSGTMGWNIFWRSIRILFTFVFTRRFSENSNYLRESLLEVIRLNITGWCQHFFVFKVCWQHPATFCLYTWSKLFRPWFEFSLKVKLMESNQGYHLKPFLLYLGWPNYLIKIHYLNLLIKRSVILESNFTWNFIFQKWPKY